MRGLPTLVVGFGNMGARHVRVLRNLAGDSAVWGIVDPDPARRRVAEEDGMRTFATLGDALAPAHGRPACATVAATTARHCELGLALIDAGVPTLIEKPIALNVAEGQRLAAAAAQRGTPLMVGHVERFNPAIACARKLVAEGAIGELLQLCFRRVGGTPADLIGQDVLADLAVHDFDLASLLLGHPIEITGALGHWQEGRLDGALVLARVAGPSGALVQVQVNWRTPVKVRRVELTGAHGYIEVNLISQEVSLFPANPVLVGNNSDKVAQFDQFMSSLGKPARVNLAVERREPLADELAAFWRCVSDGTPPPVSAADAIAAVALVEATRACMR